jgi:hypothetical protein
MFNNMVVASKIKEKVSNKYIIYLFAIYGA